MLRVKLILVTIGLCCCATPTWAAEAEAGDPPKIVTPGKQQEVVCRRERVTGSHFKKKVCRTRAMIDEEHKNAQRHVQGADRYNQAVRQQASPSG